MFGTVSFTPKRLNGKAGIETQSLGKPVASFPAAIATDQELAIAVDRLQIKLAATLDNAMTTMTVSDASQIVAWTLLSIDNEIVQVTGVPSGNQVPITRGFDGTTPALHLTGAAVSGFVDAWHHNTLVAEVEAIENALGANLSKIPSAGLVMNAPFVFAAQSPGGSLIAGANTITLSPVPAGISGSDVGHYLYISGGTGTAEAALILGGSAVGGQPTGNLIIQCANTHSGAWTIQTATGGIQEAVCSLPAAGGEVIVNLSATLYANVGPCGKTCVLIRKMAGTSITGSFTVFAQASKGDARAEIFSYATPTTNLSTSGDVIRGNNATFNIANQTYSALVGNINNFPVETLNPIQFVANGLLGAVNVPASGVSGNGSGVSGLCTTSSTECAACGVSAYANMLVDGCRAWGGNIAVSNQTAPTGTTGVHAVSMQGLELDVNVFGPGNVDGVTGLQIIGGSSNIQPNSAVGVQIAPLGSLTSTIGQPKWTSGLQCYVGSCQTAIDIQQKDTGNGVASQPIKFSATDPSGNVYSSNSIQMAEDGTLTLTGGTGPTPKGILIVDGAANTLIYIQSTFFQIRALPVYADNPTAKAAGLTAGMLYKTSTGQVMQVY